MFLLLGLASCSFAIRSFARIMSFCSEMEHEEETATDGEVCQEDWPTMLPTLTADGVRVWICLGRLPASNKLDLGDRLAVLVVETPDDNVPDNVKAGGGIIGAGGGWGVSGKGDKGPCEMSCSHSEEVPL